MKKRSQATAVQNGSSNQALPIPAFTSSQPPSTAASQDSQNFFTGRLAKIHDREYYSFGVSCYISRRASLGMSQVRACRTVCRPS